MKRFRLYSFRLLIIFIVQICSNFWFKTPKSINKFRAKIWKFVQFLLDALNIHNEIKEINVKFAYYSPYMAKWSRGMIFASGARGPGFNSRLGPVFVNMIFKTAY